MTLQDAIRAFTAADDAWSAELVRVYGRQANAARYDFRRNRATMELARLDGARSRAQAVYDAAWSEHHSRCMAEAREAA